MAFKVVFLAHAPDAKPKKHRPVEVCKDLVKEEGIHSILLCPGFTHRDVGQIVKAVGENVAVAVAGGDDPSSRVSTEVRKREDWFPQKSKE